MTGYPHFLQHSKKKLSCKSDRAVAVESELIWLAGAAVEAGVLEALVDADPFKVLVALKVKNCFGRGKKQGPLP